MKNAFLWKTATIPQLSEKRIYQIRYSFAIEPSNLNTKQVPQKKLFRHCE